MLVQPYEVPAGARLARRGGAVPVLTAGQAVLGVVGTRTFKLRLTAAGKRLRKTR